MWYTFFEVITVKTLKELRLEKELKQKEVAKAIGIELSAYGNYELGLRQVPDDINAVKKGNNDIKRRRMYVETQ